MGIKERIKYEFEKIILKLQGREKGEKENDYEENGLRIKLAAFADTFEKNEKIRLKIISISGLVLSIYFGSLIGQMKLKMEGQILQVRTNIFVALYIWIARLRYVFMPTIVTFILTMYVYYIISKRFKKDYYYDERSRVKVSKDGTYGNAHWMTQQEKEHCMYINKNAYEIPGDILGEDENGYLLGRKQLRYTNDNAILIGPPGSGKSTAILNNDILQNIIKGDSYIAVDSKGTVFRDTAYAAIKAGYKIRIFNTKPTETEHSDGAHFLKIIPYDTSIKGRSKAQGMAESLTNTFMLNLTSEGKGIPHDIWYKGTKNLLKAMMLITRYDNLIPLENRTMETMYNTLVEYNNYASLERKFSYVGDNNKHPAYSSWRTFTGLRDTVKESILGGLLTDLNFLSDEIVAKICSTDEIDFTAPGFEKCAYYLIIDDQDKCNALIANLFMECCTLQLKNAADAQKGFEAALPVKVALEIDEAANVGRFQCMGQKLSSYRSRGIRIKLIFQDISQIQRLYPNEEWREFIVDCTSLIVLKVGNDPGTSEYIEKILGTQTVIVDNVREHRHKTDFVKQKNEYDGTEGKGTRPLMYASEIRGQGIHGLKNDELIVILNGQAPIILKKWMWWNHPLYKALHLDLESRKMYANKHEPKWTEVFFAEERKEEKKRKEVKRYEQEEEEKLGEIPLKTIKAETETKIDETRRTQEKKVFSKASRKL